MSDDDIYDDQDTLDDIEEPQQEEKFVYDDKMFKKLYYRSCSISFIAFLVLLGAIVMLVLGILFEVKGKDGFVPPQGEGFGSGLIAIGIIYLVASIGIYIRSIWGRIAGIIVSVLALMNFPLGTIFGVVGLFAFGFSSVLFGHNRIKHAELKKAFKEMKARQKAAKNKA